MRSTSRCTLRRLRLHSRARSGFPTLCRVTDGQAMQEEALKEKQAVQQRLQSAVDMQSALEKAYQAKVSRTCSTGPT